MNKENFEKYFRNLGYRSLGWANLHPQTTQEAYKKSNNKIDIGISSTLHLIVCQDLKVYFFIDSGD